MGFAELDVERAPVGIALPVEEASDDIRATLEHKSGSGLIDH